MRRVPARCYNSIMAETGERIQSHIPYPELYAPEAVDFEFTKKILGVDDKSSPQSQPRQMGAPVTAIDLRRIPSRLTDNDILNAVSLHLGIEKDILDTDPVNGSRRAERDKVFHNINIALEEASNYIKNVLGLRAPKASVVSTKDIINLVQETSRYRESYHKGLQTHAAHCALVSVGLAVFELQKKEAHSLASEMAYVENVLTQPIEANDMNPLFYKYYAVSIPDFMSVTVNGITPQCRARLSMRDKSPESQITKYLMKPETSAEAALKDAIGLRIELRKERVEDVLVRVLNYIQEHLGASDIQVEDRNLLGTKQLDDFRRRKSEEVSNANNILVVTDTSLLSADSFRATKITAKIKTPRGTPSTLIDRAIEIQFIEPENKNESGLSSHAVYELKKHITVMTRLFGGCSEQWLKQHAGRIADTEGYNSQFVNNTIQGLQDVGFLMRMPNVPNRAVYAATDVYRRWLRVDGLITSPVIRRRVLHKLGSE